MPSQALPPRPSLDQLRRRAKELRDAARSGDPAALARITAYTPAARSGTVALAAAQLAIAREHGYPSWPQLVAEVRARTAERGQRVEDFLVASIRMVSTLPCPARKRNAGTRWRCRCVHRRRSAGDLLRAAEAGQRRQDRRHGLACLVERT
jgi:hypothetical protein